MLEIVDLEVMAECRQTAHLSR